MSFTNTQGVHPVRRLTTRQVSVLFMFITAILVLLAVHIARRDVVLTVDGDSRVVSTFSHTVAAFLAEENIIVGADDVLSFTPEEKLRNNMHIELKRAFPVAVTVDGAEKTALLAQGTVHDVLDKLGIMLGELDRVEPGLETILQRGDSVDVIRVEKQLVTMRTDIPFREIRRGNQSLDRGVSRVLQSGTAGLREDTVEITLENGEEVSVKVLQSEMIRAKQDRVVEFGENTVLSRGGRTVNFTRVFQFTATAYCAGTAQSGCPIDENGHSRCTGKYNNAITATGRKAVAGTGREDNPHIVAVDPKVIPLGSRLYIDGYGFAIAADTGGAIKGSKIDLLLGSHESARRFGRRKMRVYLLP
ncbi:MAG: 3D domain-containing protein [Bacillota bacterium]|nr:3D domain-containing protein [Bacillota bacterium]MDW7684700.1 3D domain-containing protein [Bacillota bacterium]